jgi:hypothetical protein
MNVNIGDNSGLRLASHESRDASLRPMGTCGGHLSLAVRISALGQKRTSNLARRMSVKYQSGHQALPKCTSSPVGMDTFIHAQYGWRCGLPWRSHFRHVAKAGDEDVGSITLHRAG